MVHPITIAPTVDLTEDAEPPSQEMQELYNRIVQEINQEGISMETFAEVAIDATHAALTLAMLFHSARVVRYEHYVDRLWNFLCEVPVEERRKRYQAHRESVTNCKGVSTNSTQSAAEVPDLLLVDSPQETVQGRPLRNRTFISNEAKAVLNDYFETDSYPRAQTRDVLARQVGLEVDVIRIYFQNRRRCLRSGNIKQTRK